VTKQELYAENRALKAELARTTAKLDASLAELQAMRVRFDQLLAQGARNNERLEELTAAVLRRSGKPPKPPAPAAPTALDDASKAAYEARPKAPELPAREPKPKAPRKPTGRKALPSHLPVEEHVFRPDACAHCGGTMLDLADEVVEEKLHVVEAYHRRRVVRRKTCRCRGCGERTTARSLPAPYERSKVTSAWLAWLVHQKFSMLAPLDRLRRDLASQGINLAMSTLVGFIERGADLLEAVNGYHWRQLLAGRWMATDGTGLKVLVPTLKAAHNGYLEVYRRDDLVVLQYEPTKDAATLEAKLAPFKGTLVSDAEHRFNGVHARPDIEEAGCNAHGRRKFRDAEAVQQTLAAEGGAFIAAMYAAEGRAREQGLQGEALRDWRQTHIRPVAESFKAWLKATKPTLIPTDPLAAAVRYYENHWDALLRFVDNPLIPIDNSASEREFQNVAKLRLNMLFAGGTEGAHRAATLLGVVGTCRAIGLNAQAYLTWVFDRVGTHRDLYALPLERLTPAAYKASLAA
jgi:transposase